MIFEHPGMMSPSGAKIIADVRPPVTPYGAWTIGFYQYDELAKEMSRPTVGTFDKSAYKALLIKLLEDL